MSFFPDMTPEEEEEELRRSQMDWEAQYGSGAVEQGTNIHQRLSDEFARIFAEESGKVKVKVLLSTKETDELIASVLGVEVGMVEDVLKVWRKVR